jgi:hypothetical protein
MTSLAGAAKIAALRKHPDVALTIDAEGFPPDVLLLRGRVEVTDVDGIVPEYAQAARRYLGDEGATAKPAASSDQRASSWCENDVTISSSQRSPTSAAAWPAGPGRRSGRKAFAQRSSGRARRPDKPRR